MSQLSFADIELKSSRKASRVSENLEKINNLVDWEQIHELVKPTNYTSAKLGGRPPKDILSKIKMLFLQHLYNLSDPELEDQVNDRLSFQKFAGINYATTVPDYSTIWRFRERLIKLGLDQKLFELINKFIEDKGLFVKKGTMVDATLLNSTNRPLSKEKRVELAKSPSCQIDTDAHSTKKNKKFYFGYKGHIGTDLGSNLIRKKTFTPANVHDSKELDKLLDPNDKAVFGDSAYTKIENKRKARKDGVYYGMQDKGTRRRKLSSTQKKKNKKNSKIRAKVEHVFAVMKTKFHYTKTVAKTKERNELRFNMNCIMYNIFRADYLLKNKTI